MINRETMSRNEKELKVSIDNKSQLKEKNSSRRTDLIQQGFESQVS